MKISIILLLNIVFLYLASALTVQHQNRHLSIENLTYTESNHTNIENHQQTDPENYDVIVVGAGIAGITAANELVSKGMSVVVLEVNDYIGGRMKSKVIKGRG